MPSPIKTQKKPDGSEQTVIDTNMTEGNVGRKSAFKNAGETAPELSMHVSNPILFLRLRVNLVVLWAKGRVGYRERSLDRKGWRKSCFLLFPLLSEVL